MTPYLVLCVDDDATLLVALRALLQRQLAPRHRIEIAESADEALEVLGEAPAGGPELAVVVCDYLMPGMRGDELLVRLHASHPEARKIMLTGQSDLAAVKRSVNEAGLYRFIEKPFDNTDLGLTVGAALQAFEQDRDLLRLNAELRQLNTALEAKVAERTRELAEKNAELERLAVTDALTRLPNRLQLDRTLQAELLRCQRYGEPLALALLDIDHFKRINDQYGHPAGDAVLQAVAGLLQTGVRANDLAGRWGGEEFLLVCPHTDAAGAAALAEKLRQAIAQRPAAPGCPACSASFGVAAWSAGDSAASLLARADTALYRAKQQGRNQVVQA